MPEEFFDIYDEELNPIGTASRREAHAKGYWHRTFHCWLARRSGGRQLVLFQRRQLGKDTNPGCYDITAAGHLLAGEGLSDAVRELEEELGLSVSFHELIHLDQVREEAEGLVDGKPFIDREVSDVYGLVAPIPLESLVLQPEEVAGVYEAEISEMLALFRGERDSLSVRGIEHAEASEAGEGHSAEEQHGNRQQQSAEEQHGNRQQQSAEELHGTGQQHSSEELHGNRQQQSAEEQAAVDCADARTGRRSLKAGDRLNAGVQAADSADARTGLSLEARARLDAGVQAADSANARRNGWSLAPDVTGGGPTGDELILVGRTNEYKLVSRVITAEQFVPRQLSYYLNVLEKLQACT